MILIQAAFFLELSQSDSLMKKDTFVHIFINSIKLLSDSLFIIKYIDDLSCIQMNQFIHRSLLLIILITSPSKRSLFLLVVLCCIFKDFQYFIKSYFITSKLSSFTSLHLIFHDKFCGIFHPSRFLMREDNI